MQHLTLGLSPCPNDTSLFFGLLSGRIPLAGYEIHPHIADVATLNGMAAAHRLDVTKISLHAYGHLRRHYALLRSGAALGQGCGPLLVARQPLSPAGLQDLRWAIPGRLTTASLLLQLYGVKPSCMLEMPFHAVEAAVATGQVEAGVLIHESRFTCEARGLFKVLDLGQWWEGLTGLPLPLGVVAARRCLGPAVIRRIEQAVRSSVEQLGADPGAAREFVRRHAREKQDAVLDGHVGLYVNAFTRDLGALGEAAINELVARAEAAGLLPPCPDALFAT